MIAISKRQIVKRLIGLGIILPTLLFIGASSTRGDDSGLAIGSDIPMLEQKMDGVDNSSHNLKELSQKNGIMVVFSCNTCPFVVGSEKFAGWEKQYNNLYETASNNNVGFVLINSNAAKRDGVDSKEEMKKHATAQKYEMNYLVDENAALADAFGAKTTPHVFIFNGKNKLVYKGSVDNSWDSSKKNLENYASAALGALGSSKKVKTTTSQPRGCSIKRK